MRSPVVEIPWGCLFDPRRHHERNTYRCMFGHCSACDCECGALVANRLSLLPPKYSSGEVASGRSSQYKDWPLYYDVSEH